jgi:Etoposide-induced protein 2.4 (EI24)
MKLLLDSFWRAAMYCLLPRVMWLSLLPLLLLTVVGSALGYFFWSDAVETVRLGLEGSGFFSTILDWFTRFGLQGFRTAVAPLVVIVVTTPVLILLVMLVVAFMMTPALISLVSKRRFPALARSQGNALLLLRGVAWSLGSTLLAGVLLVLSMPLWLIPPLVMILPPLIWGWLTYRVMSFDALSSHASIDERKAIMKEHRGGLLLIGIVTGYLGALPSLIWALGAMAAVFAVALLPVMLWLYTLVFAFSSLWFIHYCLAALEHDRATQISPNTPATPMTSAALAEEMPHA